MKLWFFKNPSCRNFAPFAVLFFLILFFFISHYKYYPGLALSFQGEVYGQVDGRVYWDYGRGFNEFDAIDVRLSAGFDDGTDLELGDVTVEAIGMKSDRSRGYGFWLVVDPEILDNNRYIVDGPHEWGESLPSGRQLKLASGAKITFPGQKKNFTLYVVEKPLAGFAKVSSTNGITAYYDGYGNNRFNTIISHSFGQKDHGEIAFVTDPYRQKLLPSLPLPRQKISAVKFQPRYGDSIKEIIPAKELTIQVWSAAGETPSVIVDKLIINGRIMEWKDPRIATERIAVEKGIPLHAHESIVYRGTVFSLGVVLSQDYETSALKILLDGKEVETTSKINGKSQVIEANCPIIHSSLSLSSMQVTDHRGALHTNVVDPASTNGAVLDLSGASTIDQDAFHWALLSVQIITAAMTVLLAYWVSKLAFWREGRNLKELVVSLYGQKRRIFWGIFIAGLAVNCIFLSAEWPGSLTPDSIEINREVKWLRFANHHPYVYGILVLGLYNIFDSPLTVIVFQTLCFHLLSGLFFYRLYREGLKPIVLIPLFFLPLLSVPINLFNITMWKDIPFSILVLFWAFFFTWLLYKKLYRNEEASMYPRDAVLLSVLFFLVCTLRFNGLMLIPVIPMLLIYFYWRHKRELLIFLASSVILLVSYYGLVPFVTFHKPGHSNFAQHILEKRSVKMTAVLDATREYYLEDYLSERLKIFLASLGTSAKADTWYNDTHYTPQEWYSVGEMRSDMSSRPQSGFLAQHVTKIFKATASYEGFLSGRFVFWNGLYALCAMTTVFLLYRWLPLSAFYSAFFLYQAAGMFFVVWPRWRYMYFLYLGGAFLLPIVALEIKKVMMKRAELPRTGS